MNDVESLIFAEGTRSGRGFGVAVIEVGAARVGIWIGARRIWIGMAVVSRLRISILYGVHVHVHGAGRVVKVNRVSFESCRNFLYEFRIEVEGGISEESRAAPLNLLMIWVYIIRVLSHYVFTPIQFQHVQTHWFHFSGIVNRLDLC